MTHPVEAALEAALIVMRNGGSTAAADRSFANILAGFKTEGVSAAWRLDFIAATSRSGGQLLTVLRPVGPIGVNLVRAAEVAALSERVAKGQVAVAALDAELARVKTLPAPYNRWVVMAAAAFTAAFFSQLPGGDWGSLAIAFVAAGGGQFLRSILQARNLAVAPVTLICGMLSVCIASLGLQLGLSDVTPATLIGSVIYMVPGLPLINGFVDVVSHKYLVVGIERIANAAFLILVLAIAIAVASNLIA
jgi:uncharacterized membrane protein YjjP (DUF1212 family)